MYCHQLGIVPLFIITCLQALNSSIQMLSLFVWPNDLQFFERDLSILHFECLGPNWNKTLSQFKWQLQHLKLNFKKDIFLWWADIKNLQTTEVYPLLDITFPQLYIVLIDIPDISRLAFNTRHLIHLDTRDGELYCATALTCVSSSCTQKTRCIVSYFEPSRDLPVLTWR